MAHGVVKRGIDAVNRAKNDVERELGFVAWDIPFIEDDAVVVNGTAASNVPFIESWDIAVRVCRNELGQFVTRVSVSFMPKNRWIAVQEDNEGYIEAFKINTETDEI